MTKETQRDDKDGYFNFKCKQSRIFLFWITLKFLPVRRKTHSKDRGNVQVWGSDHNSFIQDTARLVNHREQDHLYNIFISYCYSLYNKEKGYITK